MQILQDLKSISFSSHEAFILFSFIRHFLPFIVITHSIENISVVPFQHPNDNNYQVLYQICAKFVPDLCQICTRFVLNLYQICAKFVPDLYQTCTRFVPNLCQPYLIYTRLSRNLSKFVIYFSIDTPELKFQCRGNLRRRNLLRTVNGHISSRVNG